MSGPQFVLLSAFVVAWLSASLRLAGPVLLAALGETFAEQSGVLNVGIEGTMLLGALAAFLAVLLQRDGLDRRGSRLDRRRSRG